MTNEQVRAALAQIRWELGNEYYDNAKRLVDKTRARLAKRAAKRER